MATTDITPPGRFADARKRFIRTGFGSPMASVISVLVFSLLAFIAWAFLDWSVFSAVWSKENAAMCDGHGACWSVIDARYRLILFGTYPYDEHWRSTLAAIAIVVTVLLSCLPVMWHATRLAVLWIAGFVAYYLLMEGSLLGLPQVTTDGWGGLSLTLFLFAAVVLLGMPMGLGLALMRRSEMPVVL